MQQTVNWLLILFLFDLYKAEMDMQFPGCACLEAAETGPSKERLWWQASLDKLMVQWVLQSNTEKMYI